jgi:glycosyltransferase involved in cell wall biosynthesis
MNLNRNVFFLVVGRLGKSLIVSKAEPVIANPLIEKLYIFSDAEGIPIKGATYIVNPKWLKKIKPEVLQKVIRHFYEPLQLLKYALILKPKYINGVYTLPKGFYSVLVSKLTSAKSIVSVIGGKREILTYMPFTFFWKKINLSILNNSDAVTTKGEVVTEYLIKNKIKKEKIFTLNGSISARFLELDKNDREIDILFCGNFSNLKGPDRVLDVIERVFNYDKTIRAAFLGKGTLFNMIEAEIKRKKHTNIFLYGHVENTEYYFKKAKLLLMPSISEGLSTAMLEAMACGCVPIVSNVGAMTEAAHHNVNSMVVEGYNNIDDFTKFSLELLQDNNKRKLLSMNGKKMVLDKYTPEAQSVELSKIFEFIDY